MNAIKNFLLIFLLLPTVVFSADIAPTGFVKLYGSYSINTDPANSNLSVLNSNAYSYTNYFEITTNNGQGFNGSGHRHGVLLYPANIDVGVTSLTITYEKTGTCATAVTRRTMGSDFSNGSNKFDTATTSGFTEFNVTASDRTGGGIGFRMSALNGSGSCTLKIYSVTDNLGNEYVVSDTGGSSSSGGDFSLHPLITNGTIDNMNCVTSSTGTDCVAQYTNNIDITPLNILIFTILFAIAFSTTYWLVKRLT